MFVKGSMGLTPQRQKVPNYKPGCILPILSAKELLASARHQGLLQQTRELCSLNQEHFEVLYESIIQQYAEFVQVLPTHMHSRLSGLLNLGLARAVIVLQQMVAHDNTLRDDALLCYAIFTAALLMDVAKVFINQKIIVVNEEGLYEDEWRPFEGSMVDRGKFYKIYPIAPVYLRLQHSITPLLARQLMPELGFQWIAGDAQVFADWLDALRGDSSQGGRIARSLSLIQWDDVAALEAALAPVSVDVLDPIATQHGEAFYNWLKNGLENGDIKANTADGGVYVVPEGVFLDRRLFKQFTDIYNAPVNMNVVLVQFGNLIGIAKKGGGDMVFDQFFSEFRGGHDAKKAIFTTPLAEKQRSIREGMVIADPSLIFMTAQVPATTSLMKALQPKGIEQHRLPSLREGRGSDPTFKSTR